MISYDTKERDYNKLNFLFAVFNILQEAHVKFKGFVISKTDEFIKDLIRGY